MLNLHGEYALYWHKASFHKGFIDKLRKHIFVAHLPWKSGNVICDCNFLWLLDSLYFNISALDQHQSLFRRFCELLTCTMALIQLSDPVILSGLQRLGNIERFLFEANVILISVAAVLPALWLRMMPDPGPFNCSSQDMPQMNDLWDKFFDEISVRSVMLRWLDGTRPACINYWGGMLAGVHDGPWCPIKHWRTSEDRSDSQVVGRIENLGGCTWETSPDLFLLDLVSLILRLSLVGGEEIRLPERVLCSSQLVRFKIAPCMHCATSDNPGRFPKVFWNGIEMDKPFGSRLTDLPIYWQTSDIVPPPMAVHGHYSDGLWADFNFFLT